MGLMLGKIKVETPKYEVVSATSEYELRKYAPCVAAQVTYDPSQLSSNSQDGGFKILADYIGAFGKPQNARPEKIAMTAPVITGSSEKVAMTAPVITSDVSQGSVMMQFILPAKYTRAEDAPKPLDERVVITEEGERKYGVVKFSGVTSDEVVKERVEKLKKSLEKDGHKVIGEHLLARYNPPWITLPFLRTNEIMLPI